VGWGAIDVSIGGMRSELEYALLEWQNAGAPASSVVIMLEGFIENVVEQRLRTPTLPQEFLDGDAVLLVRALRYMAHDDEHCGMLEWQNAADHFRTSFGVPIDAPKCKCGMIKLALEIERAFYRNAAIPVQHREELLGMGEG
jgi:hypothetical protein